MMELDGIAKEESVPVVDNIRIVDQDRRRLASWVHLTAEANARLAEALEDAIKPYVMYSHRRPATLHVGQSTPDSEADAVAVAK